MFPASFRVGTTRARVSCRSLRIPGSSRNPKKSKRKMDFVGPSVVHARHQFPRSSSSLLLGIPEGSQVELEVVGPTGVHGKTLYFRQVIQDLSLGVFNGRGWNDH